MKSSGQKLNEIDEQIIIDFNKKYKSQKINQKQKDHIKEFIENNNDKKNLILSSLQYLMFFILSYSKFKGETDIKEVIEELSKNNNENEKIELIKLFLGESNINQNEISNENESESFDILNQMNDSKENDDFLINNIYSIFIEIRNK